MKKHLTLFASFIIMLCVGSVYAWSIIASELMSSYQFSAIQSQIIFAAILGVFPTSMIFIGRLSTKIAFKHIAMLSGLLFFIGYFIASLSNGHFLIVLLGMGLFIGISTGLGYWVALTAPVQMFPEKKGLITGIAAAGFGLGAIFMSEISDQLLLNDYSILEVLKIIGIIYGLTILLLSNFIYQIPPSIESKSTKTIKIKSLIRSSIFKKLFWGLFLGTFAGLMIIGSLKIIGQQNQISKDYILLSISIYAIANFFGRLFWGYLSDKIGANLSIFMALFLQSIAMILLNILPLSNISFLLLIFIIAFGFGGNFVLFAKESAEKFGVEKLGLIYPFVFLGYAIAGILGPISGGLLFDFFGHFIPAIYLAGLMSLMGSLIFLREYLAAKHKK